MRSFQDHTKFYEKYEECEKVGEGSNGVVKKYRHKKKAQFYAVKKLKYEDEQIHYLKRSFHFIKDI